MSTTTDRIEGLTTSVAVKPPCRTATTANISLTGLQTINGVALADGDRVLVKDQSDSTENGIYVASTAAWARALDFDGARDVVQGTLVVVVSAISGETMYRVTTANPIVIGSSAIAFVQSAFSALTDADVTFLQAGTGAISRTTRSKLRDVVAVMDFGAAGDGVTDDTTAVAAALATGKDVFVNDNKTFLVTGLTASTASQRIFGHGTIKLKGASNQAVLRITANGIVVDGVQFDGNKASQTTVDDILGSVIYVPTGVNDVEVMNCVIANAKRNGIAGFGNSTGCKYVGNRITSPGFIGIYPSSGSSQTFLYGLIANNYITSPGQDGIGTVGMHHCSIVGNRIYQPVTAGISLEAGCKWTTVTGNTILGSAAIGSGTATGIQVNDSQHITISGNTVKKCGNGIGLGGGASSQNVAITGNVIDDCGYGSAGISLDTSVAGGYLGNYKYGVTCTGNSITNSRYAAILINALQGAIVSHNVINGFNLELNNATNRFMGAIVLRAYSHNCHVSYNQITDATGGNLKAGIIEVYDGAQQCAKNQILYNQISGLNQDICIAPNGTDQSNVVRPERNTSAPTANSWPRGSIALNSFPAAGGAVGWISTHTRGGTFSAVATTASTTNGSADATFASTDGWFEGMTVSIAGAITASWIVAINRATKVVTLGDNAGATLAGAAVAAVNPTFSRFGSIYLEGSAVYDPPNLADGAGTTTTVTVTGAAVGDFAEASFSNDISGITVTAWVSAANTVSVRFQNESGGALDLASGTLRARVRAL